MTAYRCSYYKLGKMHGFTEFYEYECDAINEARQHTGVDVKWIAMIVHLIKDLELKL